MLKWGALFLFLLAGCAGNLRYQVECKSAPGPHNYGWKTCPDTCPEEGTVVVVKTFRGDRTYRVSNCSDHFRVIRWKRLKGR